MAGREQEKQIFGPPQMVEKILDAVDIAQENERRGEGKVTIVDGITVTVKKPGEGFKIQIAGNIEVAKHK
jgi:hypothetical protein